MIYQRDVEVMECCATNNVPEHCMKLCNGKEEKFYGEEICIGAYDNTRIYCVQGCETDQIAETNGILKLNKNFPSCREVLQKFSMQGPEFFIFFF